MTVVEKDKGVCNFLMLCFGLLCKVFMILLVNYDRLVFGFSVMCMNAVTGIYNITTIKNLKNLRTFF